MIDEFANRHEKLALCFSGGKDSIALLLMFKEHLHKIDVIWNNHGNPYPETLWYMEQFAKWVPNFIVLQGNQKEFIKENGYPVDVLPFESTALGELVTRKSDIRLCSYADCCDYNKWTPVREFIKNGGYTGVIKGFRTDERVQGTLENGQVLDGIEYCIPLADWDDDRVKEYVGELLPASYGRGLVTSLECINCTAQVQNNPGRIADLKNINKEVYDEVRRVHLYLKQKLDAHSELLAKE